MKRILHLLSQIPSKTGSGIFLEKITREFERRGYPQGVILGLPNTMKDYKLEHIDRSHTFKILFETPELPFKIPGMSDVMPYDSHTFVSLTHSEVQAYKNRFKTVIREAILSFRPDIILTNHLYLATACACEVLQELKIEEHGPKIFGICHGTDLRQMKMHDLCHDYIIGSCQHLDGIFSLHHTQALEIQALYGYPSKRITLIGNGYDSDIFNLDGKTKRQEDSQKIELIYAGKISKSKGLIELIKAVELLPRERYKLFVAGNGTSQESMALIDKMKHSDADIEYLGQLTQDKLAGYFKRCHIFVLPSFYEGLPLVIIEALASGIHIVTNDLPGLRDWIGPLLNENLNIHYVPMPPLEEVDQCASTGQDAYIEDLKHAILSASGEDHDYLLWLTSHYDLIQSHSWQEVQKKIESIITL